jgi:hypothetical protein
MIPVPYTDATFLSVLALKSTVHTYRIASNRCCPILEDFTLYVTRECLIGTVISDQTNI